MNKLQSFFYGIIAASGATIFQQIFLVIFNIEIIDTSSLTPLLIFGALSEEIFKFLVIHKLAQTNENSNKLILNSFFVGFGFSLIELTFKIWNNIQEIKTYYFDYLEIILIHSLIAGIIGYFLTLKWPLPLRAFCGVGLALLAHLAFNALKIYVF